MKIEKKSYGSIKFLMGYPDEFSENEKYPTIILLHGAGGRGDDLDVLAENPFFKITKNRKNFGFVVAAPLCNADTWFDFFGELIEFVGHVRNMKFVDSKRFYGMGPSMGGYGTWQLAMSRPEWFAAIVPICGGGMYWNGGRLKNVPVWAFHGDADMTVSVQESIKMTEAVKNSGGEAKLTIYENGDHDAWSKTYGNDEVFEWLLSNKKKDAQEGKTNFFDSDIYG